MSNKNTRASRARGWCSQKDEQNNGNKIFKGEYCDTAWNAKASNKRARKVYGRKPQYGNE
jgi:hypothetical protein